MSKVNCATVRCSSSTCGINKRKKEPCDRICSLHFVDGIPTNANLLSTMYMGWDVKDTHYHLRNYVQWKVKLKFKLMAMK